MLDPRAVVDNLRSRSREPLRVFWVRVSGNRNDFRRSLIRLRADVPVVPWVLRTRAFQDPNSVMNDVRDVLDDARDEIQAVQDAARTAGGVDLVLLGRTDLNLVDTGSPVLLPDWFPVAPLEEPTVRIADLTWSTRVSLSDPILAIDDLRRILHDLDHALTNRLQASLGIDHRLTNSLWDRIRRTNEKIDDELPRMKAKLNAVSNATTYRPSAAHSPTVVGLLWAHANGKAPDDVQRTAKALAAGLHMDDVEEGSASLAAVLNRPTNRMPDRRIQWAFCLIVAVRGACQLVTAAAHADEYPQFGAQLLQSTSHDLRSFLDDAVRKLRTPGVGP